MLSQVSHTTEAYPSVYVSVSRLTSLSISTLPFPGWDASPLQGYPPQHQVCQFPINFMLDAQSMGQSTKMLGAQTLVKLTEYCIIMKHKPFPSFHEVAKMYVCCTMPTL